MAQDRQQSQVPIRITSGPCPSAADPLTDADRRSFVKQGFQQVSGVVLASLV